MYQNQPSKSNHFLLTSPRALVYAPEPEKNQYLGYFNSSTINKTQHHIRFAPSKSITEVAPSNRHTMHSVVVRKNLLKGV